ncbi:MAG TPA: ribosome recycling factor [Bdellovibrionales bacterium]|nr:ribosome recycling factor [Bdellovibrionales bacterium]
MTDKIKQTAKTSMDKTIEALQGQLSKVRTGRANVSMLDPIRVNYYGNMTPLNQVAALSCPDAKSFLIAPWEAPMLKEIESAIVKSEIGMTPQNDGKVIRLKLPDLTEERRKELVKNVKKLVEDGRVAVRMHRRDANEALKNALKGKTISEDQNKKAETEIQKLTDDYIKKIDQLAADKEKEIMTI